MKILGWTVFSDVIQVMAFPCLLEVRKINPLSPVVILYTTGLVNCKNYEQAHLRVLYGSQNKQVLFPYTALTDWFV
jgi:hypothetical protein